MSSLPTSPVAHDTQGEVVGKVLRRAEVAKVCPRCPIMHDLYIHNNRSASQMARKLQDRLALANYKAQHDLEGMTFAVVEAHVATRTKRNRDATSTAASSETSSTSSDHRFFSNAVGSSPATTPFFSDNGYMPQGTKGNFRQNLNEPRSPHSHPEARKRVRTQSMAPPLLEPSRSTWKAAHNLP